MTDYVEVRNTTRGIVLASRAEHANTFWGRFLGLMGRPALDEGGGLVLTPGGEIHMFFMRVPLDVLHVDREGCVSHVLQGIKPWRIGPLRVAKAMTVELPAGAAGATQPGDRIEITPLA